MGRIEANRRDLDARPRIRAWASPAIHALDAAVTDTIRRHAHGAVLDVGCGAMPYRDAVLRAARSYDGLDVEERHAEVRFVAPVTDMAPVESSSYDTVLCSEVLEHVSAPDQALSEIARVLRVGGKLILTVPFLGRLHEEPHDYARYTEHGLRVMCERAGLKVEEIRTTGSLGSFLGHQLSTGIVGATWHVPLLRWIFFGANVALVVVPSMLMDRLLGPLRSKLPLGYVLVASSTPPDL